MKAPTRVARYPVEHSFGRTGLNVPKGNCLNLARRPKEPRWTAD
jgi:hypothetical protein